MKGVTESMRDSVNEVVLLRFARSAICNIDLLLIHVFSFSFIFSILK